MQRPQLEKPDISEKGARDQRSDRRLFMQLFVFTDLHGDVEPMVRTLREANVEAVLYLNMNDPHGVALLTMSEDPNFFVDNLRPILQCGPFARLAPDPKYTMVGRTYALGYEPDLEEALLLRPRRHVLNPQWPWAIWYPLRRSGEFAQLTVDQQRQILSEHGQIGMSFGAADFAHDVRLACHGLDKNDNDFVIGLTGSQLYPLSAIVQTMRGTQQTSLYLTSLGPFFVGKAVWMSGDGEG